MILTYLSIRVYSALFEHEMTVYISAFEWLCRALWNPPVQEAQTFGSYFVLEKDSPTLRVSQTLGE